MPAAAGRQRHQGRNVHSIAIQVPISDLHQRTARPTNDQRPQRRRSACGPRASRQTSSHLRARDGTIVNAGPWVQVSRLGNPLVNEVIIPMGKKNFWNSPAARRRQPVRRRRRPPGARRPAARALPGGVPEPGRAQQVRQAPRRSRSDPADRHPGRDRPRLPELHRPDPGRHAPAEHGHPADHHNPATSGYRWRPRRVPERPAGLRRRHHHRAPRPSRGHVPARRQNLHA